MNGTEGKISIYPDICTCLYALIYHSTEWLLIKDALHVLNVITEATFAGRLNNNFVTEIKFVMKSLFRGYILYFLDFSARTVFLSRFI